MFRTLAAALLLAAPAAAQETAPTTPAPPSPPPKLVVAISVDQFSADLFAEYRSHFTGGLARLAKGAVFPSGYQSHAATETCPGHSTILTGNRPAHTGIIANDWIDVKSAREDKTVYCAEDEAVPGSTSSNYTVSPRHLMVPTLGDRMKAANPANRVVSVAGKDRAAVMMGGHVPDQIWWWGGKSFVSYADRPVQPIVARANTAIADRIALAQPARELPDFCKPHDQAITAGTRTVGTGRFAREAGDRNAFRASPEFDSAILALAAAEFDEMKLGRGPATDLLIVGASATDYVGHGYGTEGTEMCIQLASLDRELGTFFDTLDASGVDYVVVLTADHGGHDLPERNRLHGAPEAARADIGLSAKAMGERIAPKLGLTGQRLLWGGNFGDIYLDPKLDAKQRARVQAAAIAAYRAHPQVAAVFTRAEIMAAPEPVGPPETWSLLTRAKASFYPPRSGDFVVALKPRVTPIPVPGGAVATHGSFWDYDRRVPILFWRKGMTGFEQPLSVETVDILPTLAAVIGLPVAKDGIDGRCLDLDAGPGDSCAGSSTAGGR
ncbi:alkaline phosphatase family protein [Sphingomonas sp.]|uniref:alkaline phosphatase family protein n=1 Tax=Sphingomonas sp. TaxID=28214 RepID=UPI001EBF9F3F|nr:alkaline phosphatase family protein [Sphingomonas sp.]MBX3594417.1 alkaline phosphatase family protein [Sphingomonas sp.]